MRDFIFLSLNLWVCIIFQGDKNFQLLLILNDESTDFIIENLKASSFI